MLSAEDNDKLTDVAPGSPIGDLLRRYWMPIAAAAELDDDPVKALRILGEDLVLYKDKSGNIGLIDRHCPHRGSDLLYGMRQECGLRCVYHGWVFDHEGACREQPFEQRANPDSKARERIRTKAYPVQEKGGLLFAYFGPKPAPLLPDYAGFHRPGYKLIAFARLECNWVQVQENLYDTVHGEWLHDKWPFVLKGVEIPPDRPTHTGHEWEEFEYGYTFRRHFEGAEGKWPGHTVLWPNGDGAGGQGCDLGWNVPIDKHNTLFVYWHNQVTWTPANQPHVYAGKWPVYMPQWNAGSIPTDAQIEQDRVPYYYAPITRDKAGRVEHTAKHLMNQDFAVLLGQGRIADRTREHLGASDTGVILFRKKLFEQAAIVAQGGEPKGIIRDPAKNERIQFPPGGGMYGLKREGLPAIRQLTLEFSPLQNIFFPHGLPEETVSEMIAVLERSLRRGASE